MDTKRENIKNDNCFKSRVLCYDRFKMFNRLVSKRFTFKVPLTEFFFFIFSSESKHHPKIFSEKIFRFASRQEKFLPFRKQAANLRKMWYFPVFFSVHQNGKSNLFREFSCR